MKIIIYAGVKPEEEKLTSSNTNTIYEDQAYLRSQTGTALLDKFTHCLLVKCSSEVNFNLYYMCNVHCLNLIKTQYELNKNVYFLDVRYVTYDSNS